MEPTFTGYLRLADAEAMARGETVRVWLHRQENVIEMTVPITWVRGRDGPHLLVGRPPSHDLPQEEGLPEEVLLLLAQARSIRSELVQALQSLSGTYQVPLELEERMRGIYLAIGQEANRLRLQSDPLVQAKLMEELRERFRVAQLFLKRCGERDAGAGT